MSDAHSALHQLHDVSVLFPSVALARAAWKAVFKSDTASVVLSSSQLNGMALCVEKGMDFEALDLRHVERAEGGFHTGAAYIGINLGLMDQLSIRRMTGTLPDPWAPGGRMREASLLVKALLALEAHAVVLHKAAATVKSAAMFQHELGELSDPTVRPWLAWIDVLVAAEEDGIEARTYGMPHYFGAPNVKASAPEMDAWSIEAIAQAVKFVSGRFASAGDDATRPPSHFAVPLWYGPSRAKPEVPKQAPTRVWKARLDPEDELMLMLESDAVTTQHPARLWNAAKAAPDAMPFETYARALADTLSHRLAAWNLRRIDEPRFDAPGLPPVRVLTFTGRVFEMHITAGFGAIRTHAGTDEAGTAHAELCIISPLQDSAAVERALLSFGALAFQTTAPGGLKDYDHLAAGANGWGYLVVPLEDLALSPERPIALRVLVPVTRDEIDVLKQGVDRAAFYTQACPTLAAVAERWGQMRDAG